MKIEKKIRLIKVLCFLVILIPIFYMVLEFVIKTLIIEFRIIG